MTDHGDGVLPAASHLFPPFPRLLIQLVNGHLARPERFPGFRIRGSTTGVPIALKLGLVSLVHYLRTALHLSFREVPSATLVVDSVGKGVVLSFEE